MKKLIEIKNLTVAYGEKIALEKANFIINENDFIGIIGPNGGGKTTLLKSILGLIHPTSGEIIFSSLLKNKGGDIGYLPQVNKFDHRFPITVFEVILSGLSGPNNRVHPNTPTNKKRVIHILHELGLDSIIQKPIGELSGGQMQRVFLGRAIISDPKIIILDEPSTYVDNQFESELYSMLKKLNRRMAILLVSHDVGTISTHVKSITCINKQLHVHPSNIISPEQLASYNCPIQMITHGDVPHTVLAPHKTNN